MGGFTDTNVGKQAGKCFVVTGANAGLGYRTSLVLARQGARVVLACRDETKAMAAMANIRAHVHGADLGFLPLDQADLDSVKRAAQIVNDEPHIDVLVNNAGVMMPPLSRTAQGYELQFGVNHLGCFALTGLILAKLAERPGSRVVVTSSIAHKSGRIDWDDINADRHYGRYVRYAASKFANAAFLVELDRRLRAAGSPVTAVGCHPGIASTELMRHLGFEALLFAVAKPFINTAAMGAWPTLHAAAGPVTPGGYYGPTGIGEWRGPSGPAKLSQAARDPAIGKRLWDMSVAMTGIDPSTMLTS
ncbi:oxidoreductase [Novosphingobium sp. Leaf2]|uniref:oxidoreductase n=1 Tax=Novosphingobium sp. Leaf2 TaxID=1735670 RepID=UPI0006FD543E|nr:oxidoreductase [Novosphingobium sp. Leaf2]KQM13367.1 oxidoreductase [Novosphingobium sp. Leaf2]